MSALRDFQQVFAQALLEPSPAAQAQFGVGLAVYQNTVAKGLVDVLRANFPTVLRLIGDECFDAVALCYAHEQPPRQPSLALYGAGFAEFVRATAPAQLMYLFSVAQLDRLWTEAHFAADAPVLLAASLAELSPQQLGAQTLQLHPATRFGCFPYSAVTVWRANRPSEPLQELDISDADEAVLITRPHGKCTYSHSRWPAMSSSAICSWVRTWLRPPLQCLRWTPMPTLLHRSPCCYRPVRFAQKPITRSDMNTMTTYAASRGGHSMFDRLADLLQGLLPDSLLLLVGRFGIAGVFFLSGRTKVEGWLGISDSTYSLFATEYRLPLLSPTVAAHAATYAEHLFPMLLVLGLFTRYAALGLLGMTLVIQTFVYPDAWSTHLSWAAILLPLIAKGGGGWSLDRLIGIR